MEISDDLFRQLLLDSLNAIKPKVQQHAARYNNRGFMHLVTSKVRDREQDYIAKELPEFSEIEDFDSAEEEIKEMTKVLDKEKNPTSSIISADV